METKQKANIKWFFLFFNKKFERLIGAVFSELWVKRILILMQLQGFKCIKHREGMESASGGLL